MESKSEEVNEYSSPKEYYSWRQIELLIKTVADKILRSNKRYDAILGITNGGIIPARLIARELDIDHISFIPFRSKILHKEEMPSLLESKNISLLTIYMIREIYFLLPLMKWKNLIVILHSS